MKDHVLFKTDAILFVDKSNNVYSKIESHNIDTLELSNNNGQDILLKGLKTPILNNNAANKEYVDNRIFPNIIDDQGTTKVITTQDSTNPTNGAFVVEGGVGIKKNLNVGGNLKATVITTTSDMRLKNNIKNLDSTLDVIGKVKCVSYNIDDRKHYGVLAQEIEKIDELKNLVFKDLNNVLSVNYNDFIPLLINSINELNKNINSLKNQLKI